jgi:transposase-like protein
MKSPGKPSLRRDVERLFWHEIARGLSSEDAALAVGASSAAGSRWFRERGGMPTFMLAPLSGRYLSFEEREEIAICRAQGAGVREIARRLGRSPSTISRELRRNVATRGGKLDYRASVAQWKAELVARRPKTAKLATDERLRGYVQERLSGEVRRPDGTGVSGPAAVPWNGRGKPHRQDRRWATAWSPEQISARLKVDFPDDESMRISHEAIYQALYVQGRGALRRELTACLRSGQSAEGPQSPCARARQELRQRADHDQRASRRGRGQGNTRPLGGRSHPRCRSHRNRNAGGAQHAFHDAASPTTDARPRWPKSEARATTRGSRRRSGTRRNHKTDHDTARAATPLTHMGPGS